jgi:hypothetical protein
LYGLGGNCGIQVVCKKEMGQCRLDVCLSINDFDRFGGWVCLRVFKGVKFRPFQPEKNWNLAKISFLWKTGGWKASRRIEETMTALPDFRNEAHMVKCELAIDVLRSSGKLRLQVTGWSMLPTIWPGDTLLIERAEASSVSIGDIVLISRDGRLMAHRLVSKRMDKAELVTRGDGMESADPATDNSNLLGKVTLIVRNGRFVRPRRTLSFPEKAAAAVIRHSEVAARVVVGVHGIRKTSEVQNP